MLRPWKLEIRLDAASGKPVYRQIADAVIAGISAGRLAAGTALPGTRRLAQMLGVNRNTVVEAMQVLQQEKWTLSEDRKGTFVAGILPAAGQLESKAGTPKPEARKLRIRFDDGYPDSNLAPVAELARAYRQIFNRSARWQMMGYGNGSGDPGFILAVVQMLNHQRGMQVGADAVCITRGSQMAMYLVAQCLIRKGDFVLVENPGYKPAWKALEHAGARLLPVGVDREGMLISDVAAHLKKHKRVRAIYTTPHHQYPTTATLSQERRLELIRLSNEYGFTIIEDDYDNEFRYGNGTVLPLSSFSTLKRFVYIGTLSKVVAPALRIGYLASSDQRLIRQAAGLRSIIDVQGDVIMEQAVLQLMNDGTVKRHIRKATDHYKSRRDYVAGLLKRHLKDRMEFTVPEGGLAFWIKPASKIDWETVCRQLSEKGVALLPPGHYSNDPSINGVRIGFGALSEKDLAEGIRALARCLG